MPLPVTVIVNPNSGPAGEKPDLAGPLARMFGPETRCEATEGPEQAIDQAERAARRSRLVVAAGGDGAAHAVINGLMRVDDPPPLALLPMGTANNLCRTLGIPLDPLSALAGLETATPTPIDLMRVAWPGGSCYAAGIATGGNTDRVIERLEEDDKRRWGAWCYLRAALPVIADLRAFACRVEVDDEPPRDMSLWNVLVANCPYGAGGMLVAPPALPNDGLIDLVLVRDGAAIDLAILAAQFVLSDFLQDERVTHLQARSLRIESDPPMRMLVDGESVPSGPYTFEVVPAALRVMTPQPEGADRLTAGLRG